MFVDFVELCEDTERILPGIVRLQSLHQCRRRFGHAPELLPINSLGEITRTASNGELIARSRLMRRVGEDKLPDNVIEDGADIEEEISGNCANFGRSGWCDSDALNGHFQGKILLHPDSAFAMSVSPRGEYGFVQMFLCPNEFHAYSIKG